jgi:Ca2+-binding RTX toxin-like protein
MTAYSSFLASNIGNDTYYGQAGNDTIDGGLGLDTVVYAGNSSDYHITRSGDAWVVTDTNLANGNDGRDVLRNIEQVQFANGLLSQTYQQRVNSTTVGNQTGASIAAMNDGGFLVAWTSFNGTGSQHLVYTQRYDALGGKQGGETLVKNAIANGGYKTDVIGLTNGGYVVTWLDSQVISKNTMKGQVFDANGQSVGSFVYPGSSAISKHSIAALSDGGFLVTGVKYGAAPPPSTPPVFSRDVTVVQQKFDANGIAQGAETIVKPTTRMDGMAINGTETHTLADGSNLVSWNEFGKQYLARIDASGALTNTTILYGPTQVSGAYVIPPQFTKLLHGEFLVSWRDSGKLFALRYDASGQAVGSKFEVNETNLPVYAQHVLAQHDGTELVTLDNSGLVVHAKTITISSTDSDVHIESYSSDGVRQGLWVLNGTTGEDLLNASLDYVVAGGAGNDTYVVQNAAAQILENSNQGTDTVRASVSYTLGGNLENLVLTGNARINGTGNALNNVITGNAANNVLDGAAGADTLVGGKGADTYHVDNAGDSVVENVAEGLDTVYSVLSTYQLAANVENLVLAGP